ncbi:MAG: SUMF1/EgtB/PvdO family nonheme iron enzyme [Prevotella sp.]|nr:SUMF1/EgtB/PvdO family nonheme iron enzyme [Prevotella sp.]
MGVKEKILRFLSKPQTVFWLGMFITLLATSLEVFRGRNTNYFDYQDSTRMFWEGISAYNMEYAFAHEIYFLYTPVFSTIFAPIFMLPWWLGPYVWNIANFCLYFLAIWTLPRQFDKYKVRILWFLLPVLLQAIFCYQYNTVVAYLFIFAFSLLERGHGIWAVFLIMMSACTKIYGGAELAMLFCYPKTWRNFGYALLFGILLLLTPLLNFNYDNPLSIYNDMIQMVASHHSDSEYVGILFARGLKGFLLPNYRLVQLGVLALLGVIFFANYRKWKNFNFRVYCMAALSGFIILFSDCPETHTYIISFGGYCMAFWITQERKWFDWVIFWSLVVNFGILPTDVLCPRWLHEYIHETYWLDVYTYALAWLRIIWWAMKPSQYTYRPLGALAIFLILFALPTNAQAQRAKRPMSITYDVNGVKFTMKYVQGGTYTMGAIPNDTLADKDESPTHRVTVNSFYMAETEITQQLWETVMGKNKSRVKGPDHPVDNMIYDDCIEFINKLNALLNTNFRMPTEAEWEYAAKGGRHSKGYLYSGSNDPEEVAWTAEQCAKWDGHMPVKQKKPNELGLYDMCGNVSEWCSDFYHPYSQNAQVNPCNKESGWFHVVRGGAYNNPVRYSRTTNRYMYDPRRKWVNLGFRIVMPANSYKKK